ncbi:MAG: hypothetical protein Q9226_005029 [Calogaya cf. arnoldii]
MELDRLPTIAQQTSKCLKILRELLQKYKEHDWVLSESSNEDISDALARFKTWADNIGALQRGGSSLDHRLRHADIRDEVFRLLGQLLEALENLSQIASGARAQMVWTHVDLPLAVEFPDDIASDDEDDDSDEDTDEAAGTASADGNSGARTESQMLYSSILESITSLLKLSVFIRKSTRGNKFTKSSRAQKYETHYDINHVRDRFPFAARLPHLVDRLGKANAQRRQWLSYQRRHREKLAAPASTDEAGSLFGPRPALGYMDDERQRYTVMREGITERSVWTDELRQPYSALSSTKASTFYQTNEQPRENAGTDVSETSCSETSLGDLDYETNLVPHPPPEAADQSPFECPYCFSIITIAGDNAWSQPLFESRDQWFNHELEEHRRQWICDSCQRSFPSVDVFKKHMGTEHSGTFLDNQLTALATRSARPLHRIHASACPLCDYEAIIKRRLSPNIDEGPMTVPIRTFRNHLGRHLEQLALFVLPKRDLTEQDDDVGDTMVAIEGQITISGDTGESDDDDDGRSTSETGSEQKPSESQVSMQSRRSLQTQSRVSDKIESRVSEVAHRLDNVLADHNCRLPASEEEFEILHSPPDLAFIWMPPMDFTPSAEDFKVDDEELMPRREEPMFGGDIFTPGWEHGRPLSTPSLSYVPSYRAGEDDEQLAKTLVKLIRTGDIKFYSILRRNPKMASFQDRLGRTLLHYAAESGNIVFVLQIHMTISRSDAKIAIVNVKSLNGETSLMLAASQGYTDVVNWLIDNGANVCAVSADGTTALDEALEAGFIHIVGLFLSRMTDEDRKGYYLRVAGRQHPQAEKASATGEKVVDLVYKPVKQGDASGLSPFQDAIVQGDMKAISSLLSQGVDIEDYSPTGEKPLMLAASNSHYQVIQLLLDHGANINSTSNKGWTTLMHTVRNGDRAVVQQLIEHGADVNHLSPDRWTALAEATYRGHRDITALLLEQGADTESRSSHDFTPLMHASYKGDQVAVKLLLGAGANVDVSSNHDETAILLAAAGGYTSIVSILLEAGAAPEPAWARGPNDDSKEGEQQAKEKAVGEPEDRAHARGWTPLMLASQGGHQEIARILLGRGVNTEVKSPHDKTAADIALENGWIEMEPMLRGES